MVLSFLFVIVGSIIVTIFVKSEKSITLTMRIIGLILLVIIIFNRITRSIHFNFNFWRLIPDSYCGLTSLFMSIALISGKKDNFIFHFFIYVGVIGGTCAVIVPDFLDQNPSFFYPDTFSGLLHHTILLFAIVLCFTKHYFTPTLKKWFIPLIGESFIVGLGFFEVYVLKFENAYNLERPLVQGTILTWWFVSLLVLLAAYIVMFLYDLYYKKSPKKVAANNS